ncbi:MucR family transcriptional regulator [Roseibium sp. RKSG952]|uniref:MucR family transcriptional regulator n=1 Tax=Roseibium sp. RKSG952 TaxID=2529384 RepID=UPI0012BC2A06|nr:MucR family transcriptional regulator [Roseibium sp. RKSG952]
MAGSTTTAGQAVTASDKSVLVRGAVDIVSASLLASPMDAKDVSGFLEEVFFELQSFKQNFDERFSDQGSIPDGSLSISPAAARLPSVAPALSDVSSAGLLSSIDDQSTAALPVSKAENSSPPTSSQVSPAKASSGKKAVLHKLEKTVARVDDSIQKNILICLEDNRRVRDLAEHLEKKHGMTPDQYRKKWGLPNSYPMLPPAQISKKGVLFDINPKTGALVKTKP